MRLVVGLGNPGKKYKDTKHNVGFMCLDKYVDDNLGKFKLENKFRGESLKLDNLVLLKPHTFMNLSGESIRLVMDYYDIDVEDVLIIYDDLALPLGKLRLREKGSPGGHNGIKSIVSHMGTQEFQRVRIGIDSNPLIAAKDYVLGKFSKEERTDLNKALTKTSEIIEEFKNSKEFTIIMNNYN
ncbi:Peptidyl-tRNA hydrolase [Candidatus Izimaplasma bacterium HR1]|jgi:PTH1 family peptidyl-tRNA hydrolase|uniref:aminoacyl-tRNA hydrolase n=1 Tax=Candidatus Izimoplasma sp. HR1 TaxID=1541959 RepID=UPI0004F88DD7|nr:Peptidyl-tRNA hydrolase [Candidatus Izimaplasma bacterium HR1]